MPRNSLPACPAPCRSLTGVAVDRKFTRIVKLDPMRGLQWCSRVRFNGDFQGTRMIYTTHGP